MSWRFWSMLTIEEVNNHLKSGLFKVVGLEKDSKEVKFYCKDGYIIKMFHDQDCCENVYLESADSIDNENDIYTDCEFCVLEETSECGENDDFWGHEHYTWTFYKVRTNKGYDTIRWYGTSNGYYSESVDFIIVEE